MSEDKRIKKYFENMPYGNDAKSSEIHGKANQRVINDFVSNLVKQYDALHAAGDKEGSSEIDSLIKSIARQLDNLKTIKEEFAMAYGGGVGGKNLFSNYTDLNWDRMFFGEQGRIAFGPGFKILCIVTDPDGRDIVKNIEDITQNWVIKGTEEADYMKHHQDLVKQGQTAAKHPDFNIDWAVDNLLINNDAWKIFVSDKIGGVYFLQEYLKENEEAMVAGQIPDDMLHPDSFNPEIDMRLHKHYSTRLKTAFDPNYKTIKDGNTSSSTVSGRTTMSQEEIQEADELMSKVKS
tara:strand:- start:7034 stop:7909 length:876 start_codon:yes stop_codon:yes gene_type:complete